MNLEVASQSDLRELMLRDKTFLAQLYLSKNPAITRNLITNAKDTQLTLLIQILHYIAKGEIGVKTKLFHQEVVKTAPYLERTFTLEEANKLLNENRETQCKSLKKVAVGFPSLFYFLFNEEQKK